jgi:hypothetical protein
MTSSSDPTARRAGILAIGFLISISFSTAAGAQRAQPAAEQAVLPAPDPPPSSLAVADTAFFPVASPENLPRRRDLRPLAVFGVSVGVHVIGTAACLAISGLRYGLSDASVETVYGVVLGISPLVDGGFGTLVGRSSRAFTAPFGSTVVGSLIGAALAYAGVVFSMERDDPKVDGGYDSRDYFGDDRGGLGILTLVFLPALVPAAGAAIGFAAGRHPKGELPVAAGGRRFAVSPPAFRMFASAPGRDARIPGIELTVTF